MTLLTKAEFARRHGVSKPAVGKWEKNGWLVLSEGKVDAEASDKKLATYRDSKDGRATAKKATGKPAPGKPAAKVNAPEVNRPAPSMREDETPEQAAERIVSTYGADMPIEEAKRVKENYLALLNQLEYLQKDGQLVEMALARSVIFDEFRSVRDAWLNWPAKYAAVIAADLGVEADRMTEVLTAYVNKQLAALGEPSGEFQQG